MIKGLALAGAALALLSAAQPPPSAPDGERLYRACIACHALEPGRNTPAGPTLHGVVGRPIASEADFNYSPALRRLAARQGRWTAELLDRFIADPEAVAPGTEMGFVGMGGARERRVLIDWLAAAAPAPPGELGP